MADKIIVFKTELGDIEFTLRPKWDKLACDRFLQLVNSGFYNGAPWFRIVPNFVIQCGISSNKDLHSEWGEKTFKDSPVKKGNSAWTVAFGKSGQPNSRTSHVYINLKDNLFLDDSGFSAFAEITAGKDVVKAIVDKAGAELSGDQERMCSQGTEHLKTEEPFASSIVWIQSASVKE